MDRSPILTGSAWCLFLIASLSSISGQSGVQPVDKKGCPKVEVSGPKKSKAINPISYRARVKKFPTGAQPIFKWSVVGAFVVKGQGSDLLTVEPTSYQVKATLVVVNFPAGCQSNSDSIVTEITDIPYVHPPPVVSIVPSVLLITRPCPTGTRSDSCPPTVNEVELTADAVLNTYDPYLSRLVYTWFVTAGRLKGEGKTITWDLSGVEIGTYTVTVEVGYFDLKASGTATVKVADCTDCKATIE